MPDKLSSHRHDPKPVPGRVRVTCSDPDLKLEGWLGPESPRISGGFGGWDVIERPRQVGMVVYNGSEPWELSFTMIWDGRLWSGPHMMPHTPRAISVEARLRHLLAVVRGDNESHPGIVRVFGIPSLPARRWVIRDIQFGDAIRRYDDMHRVRIQIDFTLLQYVPPHFERLVKRPFGQDRGKTVVIRTKKHDTPHRVAKRSHCRWTEIRRLNPGKVRTANQKLRVGTKLRVPAMRRGHRGHG